MTSCPVTCAHHPQCSGPLCPCTAQSHHHNPATVLHVVGSHISRNSKQHCLPRHATLLFRHFQPPQPPHLHFTQRYFITALLPKSPFCMSDAQELCSNSKHQEGVQRSSVRTLGTHPKPRAQAAHSQQHILQPQPKKTVREMLAQEHRVQQEEVQHLQEQGWSRSMKGQLCATDSAALCLRRCDFYTVFNIVRF